MAEGSQGSEQITSVLQEERVFPPPPDFARSAQVKSMEALLEMEREAHETPEKFWEQAAGLVHWYKRWDQVLDWDNPPFAKWFVGGKTNVSYNCLDRHLETHGRTSRAIIWEGEPGEQRTLTYRDLHREVSRSSPTSSRASACARAIASASTCRWCPRLPIAMLACARIGAVHSVVFGGFSAEAVRDRMNDAEAKVIITADGGYRRGAEVPLKPAVDEAVEQRSEHREASSSTGAQASDVSMKPGRDVWWHD